MMLWALFLVIASSLGILACYKYPGHGCINHCICLSKMSGKKQISILSFTQRRKAPKKARLGPEKVVNTLEEEMVEEEESTGGRGRDSTGGGGRDSAGGGGGDGGRDGGRNSGGDG